MENYNKKFSDKFCKKCNKQVKPMTTGESNETHGYKLFCPTCGIFIGWGGKNKSLINNDGFREKSSKWTASRLNYDFCEICLRHKKELGCGCLEVHHKIPISMDGSDDPDNILVVCTACHKQIHFLQVYLHNHLKQYFGRVENESST